MTINLLEVPHNGRPYHFTAEDKEIAQAISEFVENRPFDINIRILPAGNAYSMTGSMDVIFKVSCSRCTTDFESHHKEKVNELLLVDANGRDPSLSFSGGESIDQNIHFNMITSEQLDLGEYLRELVAFAEPLIPLCKPECPGLCHRCGADLNENSCECSQRVDPSSPFAALEKLKN